MKLQNRAISLLNGTLVFAKPTTFANKQWVIIALSPQSRVSGEKAFGCGYFSTSGTTCMASPFPGFKREDYSKVCKWGEDSGSARGLWAIPYTPGPSKKKSLFHNCWRTASLLWFEDKTSGLTTAWTFATTNSLLWPDCWQEKQVPHLRFPFKDFSKPSFNSASCSIMQGRQAFALPPSCQPTTSRQVPLSLCPLVAIWRDEQRSTRIALVVPRLQKLLHLSFPHTFSLSIWQWKRKPRETHIPKDNEQRGKGSFPQMPVGSRTDFDLWAPDAGGIAQ